MQEYKKDYYKNDDYYKEYEKVGDVKRGRKCQLPSYAVPRHTAKPLKSNVPYVETTCAAWGKGLMQQQLLH